MRKYNATTLEVSDRKAAHVLPALLIGGMQRIAFSYETLWGNPTAWWTYAVVQALLVWLIIRNKPMVTNVPIPAILISILALFVGVSLNDLGLAVWLAMSIACLFWALLYNVAINPFAK